MIGHLLTTVFVQPIFNLLVLVYALLPGHNFGLALILFTIIVRMVMWPLVRKQLHHTKAMRAMAPELKKIKKAAKGDRQKESRLTMELYKERGLNPLGTLGITLVQAGIFIGLYIGLRKIILDPQELLSFSYPALHNLSWMKELGSNIHRFDNSLFGAIDLSRPTVGPLGFYLPAFLIVAASAAAQYFQGKQLLPQDKEARGLKQILSDAGGGKQADQAEVNAAITRGTQYLIPAMVFLFGIGFAAALPLYWFTGSAVAFLQQSKVLKEDEVEVSEIASKPNTGIKVTQTTLKSTKTKPASKKSRKGRRKR